MAKPKTARREAPQPLHGGTIRALAYARGVASGQVAVCEFVQCACRRFLADYELAVRGRGIWEYRASPVEAKVGLAEMLPNIKGPFAGQPLALAGWQCFVFANLFGFFERGTDARRFRQGVVYVPRGNGKTTLAAPIALGMTFCEHEGGAEGYAAAVTRDQARILFDTASQMVKRSDAFQSAFGVKVAANSIYQEITASKFLPVSSDAKALDGLNVHIAVCDEIASHKTSEVYDVLLTAMGKRLNPLLLTISTATANKTGIGKQLWDYSVRVLRGAQEDDRLFALIFTIDEGDDPWDEATWVKANPGWGVTVQPDAIRAIMRQARNNPAQEAAALTKHLNVWVGADEALFSLRTWRSRAVADLSLDRFDGQECHLAIDLASKVDLASVALTFPSKQPDGNLHYTTFSRSFLNEQAVMEARNASYPGWAADNYLTITMGNETDFAVIEDAVLEFNRRFRVLSVAYDPWAATQFAQRLLAEKVPMVEYRMNVQNLSEPTKELEAAIRAGRIVHDGDPILEWAIGNVVGRYDARSNVFPRKAREENKIDPAVALIMSIGRCLAHRGALSAYNNPETRSGIWIA